MKSLKNLSLAALVLIASLAGITSAKAIPTWAENYGVGSYNIDGTASSDPFYGSGVDIPRAIAPMPDGGFVVAGQIAFPFLTIHSGYGGKSDASLVRFAADGTILWQFELRQLNDYSSNGIYYPSVSYIAHMRTDAAGNIFVCGSKGGNGYTTNFDILFVAKFSPAGDLIWQNGIPRAAGTAPGTPPQSYEAGVGSIFVQMGLTLDGGVVIACDQGRPAGYTVPVITKFDANGAISFYRAYEEPDQYATDGPVAQTADGSKYVTIIGHQLPSDPQAPFGLFVLVIDASSGDVTAQRAFASPNGASELPISLIRTGDGGLASLSVTTDYSNIIFRKFNSDASAITYERLITPASGVPRFWVGSSSVPADTGSFSQTSDGGFLIGGHSSSFGASTAEDAAIMKLHSDGTLEFVSLVGGHWAEGNFNGGSSGSVATPLTDGGYGIAISSSTYTTQPAGEDFRQKPDWWVVKTDATRKVRNFTETMADTSVDSFNVTGSPHSAVAISYLSTPPYTAGPLPSADPAFSLIDLGSRIGIDLPTLAIQASSPRIVSSRNAEAVVGQHFAYHTLTAFFPTPANVTFSAANLPTGFVINTTTGVISGVPAQGSETTTPLAITLNATDGTDTATVILNLTIGDGVPFFTVNGNDKPSYPDPSATPVPAVNDTVLTFVAKEPGSAAGRVLRVQATTTPDSEGSWQLLGNGTDGFMPYDIGSNSYVLGSTDYPTGSSVYFRARLRSPSHSDLFSNVVGPFDLSPTKLRLGTTKLYISRNGMVSNIRFGVTEQNIPSGIVVKMQTTKTPESESSWTDVTNGALTQDGGMPNEFYLGLDDYPSGDGNFFRAIAMVPDSTYLQSLSGPQGPFTFIYDPAATVTVTVPGSGSNDGTDYDLPIAVGSGSFNVSADAQSTRSLQKLALLYDGNTVDNFGGASHGTTLYTTNAAGDHLIEGVAIDDLGIAGHAKPVHLRVAPSAPGKTYFITQTGYWNDPSIWIDVDGNHGVPGAADFAVLGNVDVSLSPYGNMPPDVTVNAVSLNGGTMSGVGKLTVTGFCTIGGGRIKNDVDIQSGATLLMINDLDVGLGGRITNNGRLVLHGKGGITGIPTGSRTARAGLPEPDGLFDGVVAFLKNVGQIIFHPPAGGRNGSQKAPPPNPAPKPEVRSIVVASVLTSGLITNDGGSLITNDGGSLITNDGGSLIGNDGAGLYDKNGNKIVAQGGGNIVAQGGGNIVAQGGGNIVAQGGGNIVAQGGGNIVAQGGGNIVATGGGNIVAQGGGNIISTNGGGFGPATNRVAADATATDYTQNGGETDLSGVTIIGPVTLNSGILSGTGTVIGDLQNSGGFITPGHSAGALAVTGAFVQDAGGTMIMEAAGGEVNQFDQLQVGGAAQLDGKLDLKTINGYVPLANDAFSPFGYASLTGSFSSVTSNATVSQNPTGVLAVIDPSKPNPPPGQPTNISTRMRVLTGDNVLISGFIVTGPSGSTKKVLIRGLGPSLSGAGLTDLLTDPLLEFHNPNGSTITNDNWGDAPNKDQLPDGFAPSSDKESIIIADLAPGGYTVIEKGAHGEVGSGLTEVYDMDGNSATALANVSTRGFVDVDDNVMIGGIIVSGSEPTQILVRALGPSLTALNVPGALADPLLELHDQNGNAIANDNWRDTQEAEINATGVAPTANEESAILITLPPGGYTAIVRGKNNSTGVGMVEAFKVP